MSDLQQQNLTRVAPKGIVSRSSFYRALRILPSDKREAMYEVYAFCRAVDDIADDDGPNRDRIAMLNCWRADIARLYSGGGPSDLTEGLTKPVQAFGLRQEDFFDIIDGMEMDVRREWLPRIGLRSSYIAMGRLRGRTAFGQNFWHRRRERATTFASSRPCSADDKYPPRSG